ncbi:hypothetical protein INT47_003939 [Mucor saturninus]|uniref:Uncharacterized protein n=1 Tax=Mucor saturninus TaxID=64648 RepID=A0A8H7QEP2_9FUNG|nr:hypothetical protein INT47_003939 [Mucor saturninus]
MPRPSNLSSRYSSLPNRATRSRSSSVSSVTDNIPQDNIASIAPINTSQSSSRDDSATVGAFAWIKTSIANQKVGNLEWNLSKQFTTVENTRITKNIIDFVGAQISLSTEKNWTELITYNVLQTKIRNVFPVSRYKKGKKNFQMQAQKKHDGQRGVWQKMKDTYGDDIEKLLIEQLQSDEESTDSEIAMTEKNLRLRIMVPHWRTNDARRVFEHFNEYDLILRKNSQNEKEAKDVGRFKHVMIKPEFLNQAPDWARVPEL